MVQKRQEEITRKTEKELKVKEELTKKLQKLEDYGQQKRKLKMA